MQPMPEVFVVIVLLLCKKIVISKLNCKEAVKIFFLNRNQKCSDLSAGHLLELWYAKGS